ncbi:cytochrome P450 [Dendrothele bispora CBS 962.96]|uniref:Cytochrome P450 n=1 Tax=Dendrothele bispora (strain CBS 962.96) TaxID=1314807 RepID=A0A4S8MW39_DENBC|nr:cytochrome P450 [Dendrothele bispora CBS 962.96]
MNLLADVIIPIALVTVSYALCLVIGSLYRRLFPHLRHLPGPKNPHLLYGNFIEISEDDTASTHEKWAEKYGQTYRLNGLLKANILVTQDLKAIHHILRYSEEVYHKPDVARAAISRLLGDGLLVVEGEKHKMQRRVMNPAFGPIQIRALTEIFVDKSLELRDYWMREIQKSSNKEVIVGAGLSKMTLDVIGRAGESNQRFSQSFALQLNVNHPTIGFNYDFEALSGGANSELSRAFAAVFGNFNRTILDFLRTQFVIFRNLPANPVFRNARGLMDRIGNELLQDAKEVARSSEKQDGLIWTHNLPDHQRMSDEDVLAQIPTFFVAGHETTSTSTTSAIYILTQHKDVQAKLRQELLAVGTDSPSMDELSALPYLDAFVREVLRLHAPVTFIARAAVKDDIIPLKEPVIDVNGKTLTELHVKKGQLIQIPIQSMNKDKKLWGEDAWEFKPERWGKEPEAATKFQVYGVIFLHSLVVLELVLAGGSPSSSEMKAILFTLIRAFEFDLAVPKEDVTFKRPLMVSLSRPMAKSHLPERRLPVTLTPVTRDN